MPQDLEEHSIVDSRGAGVDPATVGAGASDCISPSTGTGLDPIYDGLVDATSQVIERVITATKTF
jgi:hypothetical protein